MSNRNTLWANVFVDELARAGLKAVCIAPGSRSTPLTIAFARHGGIKIYTHLDERSAGFFALGLALASDEPVALLCTSGTAAANFFPAIVEAHMSRVPLIVITADRPPELRHSGANQTIDQVKLYGDQVLWSVDVGLPEANPPAIAIRNLRTLAARAYAKANGIRKGVVHLNMPFRKPLEPTEVEVDVVEVPAGAEANLEDLPFTTIVKNRAPRNYDNVLRLSDMLLDSARGMLICGQQSYVEWSQLGNLAYHAGLLFLVDPLSNERYDPGTGVNEIGGYDLFINEIQFPLPDLIIHVGSMPLSTNMERYLERIHPQYRVFIADDGSWVDFQHHSSTIIYESSQFLSFEIKERIKERIGIDEYIDTVDYDWVNKFIETENAMWQIVQQNINNSNYFDGAAVYDVVDLIPAGSTLFVGNSLPVRLLDQFGKPQSKRIYVYANRGASGIDGNISTALGAGAARPDQPLVAIVGDITFYHDMNGLLAVRRNGVPVTIVLLNNNGGGIFHRLPIRNFEPEFIDLFVMPHGLEFEHAAKMYGLEYVRADDRESFRQAFSESVNNRLSRIIEVRTDALHDLQRRQEIMDAVQARIRELDL